MIKIYKIKGDSMLPEYKKNDYLVVLRLFKENFIKKNRNTVFFHSKLGLLVKKISYVNYKEKSFYVSGNNNLSIKSKMLGKINFSQIEGFPILHIKKLKLSL